MMLNKNIMGQQIKRIRLEQGQTMKEFGETLHVTKGAVNNWEKGKNAPCPEIMKKIASMGSMTVEEFNYGLTSREENEQLKAEITKLKEEIARLKEENQALKRNETVDSL